MRTSTFVKVSFCNTSYDKYLVFEPRTSRFKPQHHQKNQPGNKHDKINCFCPPGIQSVLRCAPRRPLTLPMSAKLLHRRHQACQTTALEGKDVDICPPKYQESQILEQRAKARGRRQRAQPINKVIMKVRMI